MRAVSPILLLALTSLACGGGDVQLTPVEGNGFFDPAELDFGLRAVLAVHDQPVTFRNQQPSVLKVSNVRFDPPTDVFSLTRRGGETVRNVSISPNDVLDLNVTFAPPVEGNTATTLWLQFEQIEVPLSLLAEAKEIEQARPGLAPTSMTFNDVPQGGVDSRSGSLFNNGDEPGRLVAALGNDEFEVVGPGGAPLPLPIDVLPGDTVMFNALYKPKDAVADSANITFRFGNGTSANLLVSGTPSAQSALDCPVPRVEFGQVPRGETRTQRITCTADAQTWSLKEVRLAPGSASVFSVANVPTGLNAQGELSFDIVFTSAGPSRVYEGTIEIATPFEVVTMVGAAGETVAPPAGNVDVWMSLNWDTIDTDLDLHFVRNQRSPFSADNDCYFEFRNPDWGVPSVIIDDPVLDRDDRDGFGPELLDLSLAPDGSYDVYAHYFRYSKHPAVPAVEVTLSYELRGGITGSQQRIFRTCGEMWHVGRVTKANGGLSFMTVDTMEPNRWLPNAECP